MWDYVNTLTQKELHVRIPGTYNYNNWYLMQHVATLVVIVIDIALIATIQFQNILNFADIRHITQVIDRNKNLDKKHST